MDFVQLAAVSLLQVSLCCSTSTVDQNRLSGNLRQRCTGGDPEDDLDTVTLTVLKS